MTSTTLNCFIAFGSALSFIIPIKQLIFSDKKSPLLKRITPTGYCILGIAIYMLVFSIWAICKIDYENGAAIQLSTKNRLADRKVIIDSTEDIKNTILNKLDSQTFADIQFEKFLKDTFNIIRIGNKASHVHSITSNVSGSNNHVVTGKNNKVGINGDLNF
jgi:hypothetical protein